ncbi:aminoglycoside phosphotransferase [Paenibacillus sp. H1-7]|uniref:phosphotransferase n=1 Tax=Paenibacillus sp. H1-7 TaxID=2282849 RepID=UPI001EF80FF9|nr:phosphotransferase [Paenibacillus sp. H1-7]ULL17500.1 aminoglycoside phosphotransferase [Paenibacillus sp. H1-7]
MTAGLDLLIQEIAGNYFDDDEWRIEAQESGVNNTTRFVYHPTGTYVLRLYDNHRDMSKIIYEVAVLQQLQLVKLSFQIPKPVATLKGVPYVESSTGKIAVMFEYIDGERADLANVEQVKAIGKAMGELTEALAEVQTDVDSAYEPYYELYEVHPKVTREKLDSWLLEQAEGPMYKEIRLVRDAIDVLLNDIPSLCRLPMQLTHSDIVAGNVLVSGDEVSGILDFEFVTPDLRAMDAAVFLCELIRHEPESCWSLVEAFTEGYSRTTRLQEDEIAALPKLILLRSLVLCIHFLGRQWDGVDRDHTIDPYLKSYAEVHNWLESHEEQLVAAWLGQWR